MLRLLTVCLAINFSSLAQENIKFDLDCIKLSDFEYLIQIMNTANQTIFVPITPKVSFQGDSMFASVSLPYKSSCCTFYTYTIAGKRIKTVHALNSTNPDSVYVEYIGGVANFSVPSSLLELKPSESYRVNIFGRGCVNPKTLTLEIELINLNTTIKEKKNISTIVQEIY